MRLLSHQPWLKPVNNFNINERIQEETDGDMVVMFNMITGNYEIHSEFSYQAKLISTNGTLPDEFVNGYLITDLRATNLRANADYFKGIRAEKEHLWDAYEQMKQDNNVSSKLRAVERTLGRRL